MMFQMNYFMTILKEVIMTRLEELQAMYRQFILDRLGVDVNKKLK